MVQEHDEAILKHLIDVKVILLKADPMVSICQTVFYQSVSLNMNTFTLVMLVGAPENALGDLRNYWKSQDKC